MLALLLSLSLLMADSKLVGETQLKVLWFPIYQASLYTPSGRFDGITPPLYLQLTYQRDIDAEDLLKHTAKEWRHLGQVQPQQAELWLQQLAQIWPDIREGDQLLFAYTADGGAFYFNQQPIGQLSDPQFAPAFAAIWLDDNASYSKNRRQLIGEKR